MMFAEHAAVSDSDLHRVLLWGPEVTPSALSGVAISDRVERYLVVRSWRLTDRLVRLGDEAAVTVGRHTECGITIDDRYCSRVHFKLIEIQGAWMLVHLSATNPTKVNGKRVTKVYLHDGDIIEFGRSEITFSVVAATASIATDDYMA